MTFTPQFSKKMKKSVLRSGLSWNLKVSYYTITRRLDDPTNDEFTKNKYFPILSEISGMPISEIFTTND
jgi:hypothetical protein